MGLDPKAVGEAVYRLAIDPTPPLRNIVAADANLAQILPLWCRRYTQVRAMICLMANHATVQLQFNVQRWTCFKCYSAGFCLHKLRALYLKHTMPINNSWLCVTVVRPHQKLTVMLQPLENFYTSAGSPSITGWLNGEAAQHVNYNCSSQCGGAQFCGAGDIWGETAGRGSIVGYPSSAADTNI